MAHAKSNSRRGRKASAEMPDNRYLHKRRQSWYVRISVPEGARKALGNKAHIIRSLKTRDVAEARERRWAAIAAIKAEITEALRNKALNKLPARKEELKAFFEEQRLWYQKEIAGMVTVGPEAEVEAESPIRDIVVDFAHEIDEKFGEAEAFKFVRYVTDKSQAIRDVMGRWLTEIEGSVKEQTIGHHRSAINAFLSARPRITFTTQVTRAIAGNYITELDQSSGKARKTIHRHLSSLSSLWKWMLKRGVTKENPWEGQSLPKKTKSNSASVEKRPYSQDELFKLLSVPLSEVGEGKYAKPIHDLMRLGLLTGARLNELCSLMVEDVDTERQCILIREGKTKAAVRVIPVHSSVWPIVEARAAAAMEACLFHDCTPGGPDEKRSWKVTSHYSAFRQRILGKSREIDFHSFRRSFITYFEWAIKGNSKAVHPSSLAEIVGHEKGTLALSLYSGGLQYEDLQEAIDSVFEKVPTVVRTLL